MKVRFMPSLKGFTVLKETQHSRAGLKVTSSFGLERTRLPSD